MVFHETCLRVADLLKGINLIDGDRLLDEARKVLWGAYFENTTGAEIAEAMCVSGQAREILRELVGMSFDDANAVLGRLRFVLWRMTYEDRRGASGAEAEGAGDVRSVH